MSNRSEPPARAMPGRGIRVFSVRRVPVYVSPFSIIFMVIIGAPFQQLARDRIFGVSDGRALSLAAVIAVLTMISIILHEVGHALVAQSLKLDVDAITIYGFVGVTEFRPEPATPWSAFAISVSGPVVNLVIGAAAWIGYGYVDPNGSLGVLVFGVTFVNIGLAAFNMLPGLPLDGGQAFASAIWKVTGDRNQAGRAAAYAGFVVAAGLAVAGLAVNQRGGSGGWLLGTAALLALGAGSGLKRSRVIEKLPGLRAGDIARRAVTVQANLPLAEALRRAEAEAVTAVIVADSSGTPWAVMNGAAADAVPAQRRPWTTINEVSRPIEDALRIPEDLGGEQLMDHLTKAPASEYVVYGAAGHPTGVLATVDVVARIDPAAASRLAQRR